MSQRNITSFFKPKVQQDAETTKSKIVISADKLTTEENRIVPKRKSEDEMSNESKLAKIDKDLEKKIFKTVHENISLKLNDETHITIATEYNPAKSGYHPLKDACWSRNQKTPYLALTRTFQLIEETKGRLKMVEILGNFFSSIILLNSEDLLPSIYLSINQLAPAYEGLELGVAEGTLMKIICDATGRKIDFIKSQTHLTGDLGIVAEQSRMAQKMMFKPAPLTVMGVFNKLKEIAKVTGKNKLTSIKDVFIACRNSEARFFIRSLLGKLRIGIAEQSLLNALSTAIVKAHHLDTIKMMNEDAFKSKVDEIAMILKSTQCQCPNYNKIIPTLLKFGVEQLLERCPMIPGIPIKPMLAQPTKGVSDVLERFDGLNITCEWKYDGERAQIHCDENGVVSIFSRNQENNTLKYPDILTRITSFAKPNVKSYIMDSEIVAWDAEQKIILPFQVLSTRKRKNVDVNEIKVQVCVYAFDLLYLNGKPLVRNTFAERRQIMRDNFTELEGIWQFATAVDTRDIDEVQHCLDESIKGNCEGLMVKTLHKNATYEIAKRSRNWLKLKKDYLSGCGDSLDLVVIGGYRGKGKRTGSYGGFLLACYDNENEEYQSICKIGTGHTQMECDSTHSIIERKINNKQIHLPSQLVSFIRDSRTKPFPFNVHHLQYDYFLDYEAIPKLYFSIRPGGKSGDSTVNMIRALAYDSTGTIYFKTCFADDYHTVTIKHSFTDELLQAHTDFFKKYIIPIKKSYICCDTTLHPDDWFDPVQVWEVKCADLSISPVHKAAIGIVDVEKGISLRFPRFIRIRDDKNPEMATTSREVAHMYNSQDQIKNQQRRMISVENEFY